MCLFVFRSGLCLLCKFVVFRATGRQSSCSFEGQYAPRSPYPLTNDKNTGPHNSEWIQYEDRSNAKSTDLQNYGEEGRLCRPRSPMSTQRGDLSPEQPSWNIGSPLLRLNTIDPRPDSETPGLKGPVRALSRLLAVSSRLPSKQCQCLVEHRSFPTSAASFLPSSFLQVINALMLWHVCVPQASKHLCPAKLRTRCDVRCACLPVHSLGLPARPEH